MSKNLYYIVSGCSGAGKTTASHTVLPVLLLIIGMLTAPLTGNARIVLPDTMLTVKKAYSAASTDTSLAIIQAMRKREMAPTWQLDMAEGDYCFATLQYPKALTLYEQAYDNPGIKDSANVQLGLLKRLMDTHDILLNEDKLVTFIHKVRQKAIQRHDDAYLSMADFVIGKRMHAHQKQEKGYELCLQAVEMMKSSDYFRKSVELCNDYAELVQMYMKDGRYEEALRMSLLQEEAARQINSTNAKNKHSLRFVFALRASLLTKADRKEEAALAYAKWKLEKGGDCVTDKAILDYLIQNRHFDEAHDIIHEYCDLLRTQKQNYTYRMITMLATGSQVETAMGNYEEAAVHWQEIKTIVDSIQNGTSKNLMETTWDLIQREEDVKEKNNLLNVLGVILLLGMAIGAIVLYYTRRIRHRNKALLKILNSLDAYRRRVIEEKPVESPADRQEPDDGRQEQQDSRQLAANGNENGNGNGNGNEKENEDENERLFLKLDVRITRDRLFLKPDFGRDDMARLIGVDKNRIGHIMARYSNSSNASVYINTKRVEYGAKLLLANPDFTIVAVANECGMSNTVTFNRTFKEVYGMTPSEYRSNMKSMDNNKKKNYS